MEAISLLEKLSFASLLWALITPIILMGIDIITGLLGAWICKDFQSSKMRSGMAKKIGEIAMLAIGMLFVQAMTLPQPWPEAIIKFISLYLIVMELMSIIENMDRIGVPLPAFVVRVINNIGTSVQQESFTEINKKIYDIEKKVEHIEDKGD